MITCPGCQKSLPDWAQNCQFCGYDVKKVVRPVAPPKVQRPMSTDALPWVWPVYYGISGYWILSGLFSVLQGMGFPKNMGDVSIVPLVLGGITTIIGIGLVFRIEFFRGIVNVLSFLKILGGLLGAWGSFLAIPLLGGFAALGLVVNLLDAITGALMIFLIGETDKYAPR